MSFTSSNLKLKFAIPLITAIAAVFPALISAEVEVRITNGSNAVPHEFPFMVAVQKQAKWSLNWHHTCGGSLVTKRHVITAAHCNEAKHSFRVILGQHDSLGREKPQYIKVSRWHPHPHYNSTKIVHDIAVLVLKETVKLRKWVNVISLPTSDIDRAGENCTAIGWGKLSTSGPLATVLQKAVLNLLPPDECKKHITSPVGVSCTYAPPAGVCKGDSGGPLICKDPGATAAASALFLYGVVSAGQAPCGGNNSYEAFTRVGYKDHLEFVNKIIAEDSGANSGPLNFKISLITAVIRLCIFWSA